MESISLAFLSRDAALWLALAPACVALAIWVYYKTLAPLDRPSRATLRLLRILAFGIVLFALAEPVLSLVVRQPGKPSLAVLVDQSASMALPAGEAGSGTRTDEAQRVAERIDERLSRDFRIDWFSFDSDLTAWDDLPSGAAAGNTAIGEAISAIAERSASRPVAGALLLSDGASTVGIDPIAAARAAGIPIFPIHIGRPATIDDARILQIRTNPVAFVGEPTALEVEIASGGGRGKEIRIEVEDQGRVVASEPVRLAGGDGAEQAVRLTVRPSTAGRRRFIARLVGEGDAIAQNDRRSVAVQVLGRRTRVLVLEGRLDWDHAFLRRRLSADSTFSYRFLLAGRDGRWLPDRAGSSAPAGPGPLRDYAAVVLGEIPRAAGDAGLYAEIARFVDQGGGLWVLGGVAGAARLRGTPLEPLLPVEIAGGAPAADFVSVRLAAGAVGHPVAALDDVPSRAERLWSGLPPIRPSPDRVRPRPNASVILSFAGRMDGDPALVTGFAGQGKVALFSASEFWRWDFLGRRSGEAQQIFPEFALRMVRWLAEPTLRDRFVAEPVRGVFQNGEAPEFEARLWDERYQPISDARVRLTISPSDSAALPVASRAVELLPRGQDGNYAAKIAPLPPGEYRCAVEARSADSGTSLGSVATTFWVDSLGAEHLRIRPDAGTLEQIARVSGGKGSDAAGLADLLDRIPEAVRRGGKVLEIDLWNHLALFLSFIVVLSIEWFLRRRRGLA